MSIHIIRTVKELHTWADDERRAGRRIAFVPTMGALHRGHTSLIEQARSLSDSVVTTIFVNPTQFGPEEDLTRYPRPLERDIELSAQAGASVVFTPSVEEIYPAGFQTFVDNSGAALNFEGAIRPGHFRGVVTIVTKLLLATKPHIAVFGQKDAQQVAVVRALIRDLNMDVELVVGSIVREPDGLALSSRNVFLTADERSRATVLSKSLQSAQRRVRSGERSSSELCGAMMQIIESGRPTAIDYVAIVDPATFVECPTIEPASALAILAVRFGTTRLLDNAALLETEHPHE